MTRARPAHAAGADAATAAGLAVRPARQKGERRQGSLSKSHRNWQRNLKSQPIFRPRHPTSALLHALRGHRPIFRFPLFCLASPFRSTAARRLRKLAKSAPETAAPVRPSGFSKPSTLIDTPIEWDGSGLLPGESISRHRTREPEPVPEGEAALHEAAPAEVPDQWWKSMSS